ncbi:hypothetical protein JFL43_13185 [Viridibacillus sp. YIM B01967]|uniref:Uncharacterized protein n=1 Tax=Viridibacillus soli TaxID=2798301 RepID=A0ABS1H9L1_9BACL|nr:hypothetical protein [Viridibacillus soli]MBK3495792.1 hypothetical protein [Viridibacillus soli]
MLQIIFHNSKLNRSYWLPGVVILETKPIKAKLKEEKEAEQAAVICI